MTTGRQEDDGLKGISPVAFTCNTYVNTNHTARQDLTIALNAFQDPSSNSFTRKHRVSTTPDACKVLQFDGQSSSR